MEITTGIVGDKFVVRISGNPDYFNFHPTRADQGYNSHKWVLFDVKKHVNIKEIIVPQAFRAVQPTRVYEGGVQIISFRRK